MAPKKRQVAMARTKPVPADSPSDLSMMREGWEKKGLFGGEFFKEFIGLDSGFVFFLKSLEMLF